MSFAVRGAPVQPIAVVALTAHANRVLERNHWQPSPKTKRLARLKATEVLLTLG